MEASLPSPPPHRSRPRRAGRSLVAAAAASALVVGATACAGEADDAGIDTDVDTVAPGQFEATAAYLSQAADRSAAESYRIEMLLSLTGEVDESAPPFMSGTVDGDSYHYVMDMGPMFDQMADAFGESLPPELADVDMSMEMAGDLEELYLRAPMYAELGDTAGAGPMADLGAIGDGWGYVDMGALGEQLPTELASAMTSQGLDPRAVLEIVQDADDVDELGSAEVRGEPVDGLSAEIALADLMRASGQDPDALAEIGGTDAVTEDAMEALYEATTTVDVWIDGDGYLARLELGWSFAELFEAMGEDPGDLDMIGLGDLEFRYAIDMFDYGATIDFEPPADVVDVTDAFAALAQV